MSTSSCELVIRCVSVSRHTLYFVFSIVCSYWTSYVIFCKQLNDLVPDGMMACVIVFLLFFTWFLDGSKSELTWVAGFIPRWFTCLQTATNPPGVGGTFTCVGCQVTLCDLIWQVMLRSSEVGSSEAVCLFSGKAEILTTPLSFHFFQSIFETVD